MKCKLLLSALALIAAVSPLSSASAADVLINYDGGFPGPTTHGGGYGYYDYSGVGPDNLAVPLTYELVEPGAGGAGLAFATTVNSGGQWWYYGTGIGLAGLGEGAGIAGGQPGEDNPANYTFSFDLKAIGNTAAIPLNPFQLEVFKGDYEVVHDVDLNNDGDKLDGYQLWVSSFTLPDSGDSYASFYHVSFNLAAGTAPTAAPEIGTPAFDDESNFTLTFSTNDSMWGQDDGNTWILDNFAITFTPPTIQPGDFNQSGGRVDGNDFLSWQRGEAPGGLTNDELTVWKDNYGLPLPMAASVPEPASAALLLGALATLGLAARRRAA